MSKASSLSPGSNFICNRANPEDGRIRREWDHMDDYDRALYLDAVETAIERGLHQRFAEFHSDEVSDIQAHDTCAFWLWHRVFILAYENMLRSLEPRFACLTLPFWDIYRDYAKQESTSNACKSYSTCSKIINDIGGLADHDELADGTFFGRKGEGLLYSKPPVQNLRDDNNFVGMIRYDLWFDPIPEEVGIFSPDNIKDIFGKQNRIDFWETLHHGIHDSVHDTIGGFMRTPASPIDPLFMPWHSTMELFDYLWGLCHFNETANINDVNEDGIKCTYTPKAREYFPNISLNNDEAWVKLDNTTDVRNDTLIGKYFDQSMHFAEQLTVRDPKSQFRYADIPVNFIWALGNNTLLCPNGLGDSVLDADYSNEPRQPPAFSNEQLEKMKQSWIDQAQDYYDKSGSASASGGNIDFLRCLLSEMDRDTIERWAIDEDTFMTQVVENMRYARHPLCQGHLSAATSSQAYSDTDSPTKAPSNKPTVLKPVQPSVDTIINGSAGVNSGHFRACGGSLESLSLVIILYWFRPFLF
mmetsp:Transcript_17082/g.31034  ORF Transcript_17082/g.31034 Transcript_17082/m.31034 type:complete len:528 (-) Transcript_17082:57-1640(-)